MAFGTLLALAPSILSGAAGLVSAFKGGGSISPVPIRAAAPTTLSSFAQQVQRQSSSAGFITPISTQQRPIAVPQGVSPAMSVVTPIGPMVRSAVAMILAKIAAFTGRRITRAGAVRLLKNIGIQAGATALGITLFEALTLQETKVRRRRGISAANLRTTKRVIKQVCNIGADLKAVACLPGTRKKKKPC